MKLAFVLTFKGSLEKWTREGIANREMEVCFEYLRRDLFSEVLLYTYSPDDPAYLEKLNFECGLKERIRFITPCKKPSSFFDYVCHSVDVKKIREAVQSGAIIWKTNQINGAWTALIARLFGAKVLLRCGYILSRRLFKNNCWAKGIAALLLEAIGFNFAASVSVTTQDARAYASRLLLNHKARIFIAPTYVNTDIFRARVTSKPPDRKVLYVGRLEPQKNVLALVEACQLADAPLTIVGQGSLKDVVLERAKQMGVMLTYRPMLMNEELVPLFASHRYFLLPSLHEGLPKVLIEAMAAEMVCIGTPTSGTMDLLKPNNTGYLATGFSAQEIAAALMMAMSDPNADSYAAAARAHIVEHNSIKAYADREFEMMQKALG